MGMTMLIPEKASAVAIETENKTLSGTLLPKGLSNFPSQPELHSLHRIPY